MSIHNEKELSVTQEKLRLLEERVAATPDPRGGRR